MQKQLFILFSLLTCNSIVFAQATKTTAIVKQVPNPDNKMSLDEAVFAIKNLQQEVNDLKTQLATLQSQVNANYKLLDYSFGKLSKAAPVVFTVEAGSANLADPFKPVSNNLSGVYYGAVIIDNAACNGNADAIVLVTSQSSSFGYNVPASLAVKYDSKMAKWKIVINPHVSNPGILGLANPKTGSNMVAVAEYYPYQINNGDRFNVYVQK